MKQLIERTRIIWIFIVAVSFVGCNDDDDAILPEVSASFAHTINEDTGRVSFLNLSENADTYNWDFGDGTTSTEINPIKSFPTGNYTVVLTAENAAGASSTFTDELFINIPVPVAFPINFDDANVNYGVTTFNGVTFEVVDNPDPSGSNSSASKVGAITNSGAAFEGFFFDLGTSLDLTSLKSVKVNFWSDTPIDVLLKLEEGTGAAAETTASHGGTGWEEIYFTFDSADSFSRFTLFVDGPGTTAGTFYIDDISQVDTADVPCTETELKIPIDFDCNGIDYATKIIGNVSFMVVDNPEQSGINSDATKVGQMTNAGVNWENAFFNLNVPVDFSTDKGVKMKLYSDQALPILLKFEDGTEGPVEDAQNHGGTGWEELTFALNSSASYNDMVIFVDGPGTAAGNFYIDDIEQINVQIAPPFDSGLLTNGDFESGAAPWIQGVDDNSPAPVVTENGNTFYSVDVTAAGNSFDVNMSQKLEIVDGSTYTLTFDAWSDRARTIVAGIGLSGGSFANTTETVNLTTDIQTFTLTLTAAGFGAPDARVLFDSGAEVGLVNIDNVSLVLGGGGSGGGGCTGDAVAATSLPLDFEGCESFISAFSSIGDGGVVPSLDANPSKSGINTSDNVLKVVRASGINRWGGVQNSFPAGVIDITTKVFKVKVYSSVADVTYRFELALDPQTDPVTGNPAPQFVQVSGGANEWVELEFTFTNLPATPTTYNQLVIKPDNPDGSDGEVTAEERIFYFDDLRLE